MTSSRSQRRDRLSYNTSWTRKTSVQKTQRRITSSRMWLEKKKRAKAFPVYLMYKLFSRFHPGKIVSIALRFSGCHRCRVQDRIPRRGYTCIIMHKFKQTEYAENESSISNSLNPCSTSVENVKNQRWTHQTDDAIKQLKMSRVFYCSKRPARSFLYTTFLILPPLKINIFQ